MFIDIDFNRQPIPYHQRIKLAVHRSQSLNTMNILLNTLNTLLT